MSRPIGRIQDVHQDAGAAPDPWRNIGRTLAEGVLIQGVKDSVQRMERVCATLAAVGSIQNRRGAILTNSPEASFAAGRSRAS